MIVLNAITRRSILVVPCLYSIHSVQYIVPSVSSLQRCLWFKRHSRTTGSGGEIAKIGIGRARRQWDVRWGTFLHHVGLVDVLDQQHRFPLHVHGRVRRVHGRKEPTDQCQCDVESGEGIEKKTIFIHHPEFDTGRRPRFGAKRWAGGDS